MSTTLSSNIWIPTSFPHPPLDANGSNYTSWVISMDLWLSLFNLWCLLTGDKKGLQCTAKDANESDADLNQCLTSITKGLLGMTVHSSDLIHFMGATDPAIIWKALDNKYKASVGIHFTSLMGCIFDLPKASDSDSLTNIIKEITDIKAQFKVIKLTEWKCNEYTLIQALLHALPKFYALLSQLILHSANVNARKLTLKGIIGQIRNSEQYYANFGSANLHTHHTAMATRAVKSDKPTEHAKLKELDVSKGDKWELSWHSTSKSDSLNTSAHIPPSSSWSTNLPTPALGQPDVIPSLLHLSALSASFSNISTSSFSFHIDSAATAHMELDYSHFTCADATPIT
ncbi:hypothetical protein DFH29DRAFT_995648 [Suillus ampliporus]|nr:hypothetical protein DFH29DRAFT_995648 [Suillus ampliporus]